MIKRVMDLTILLICAPFFVIPCIFIAVAIKLDSNGPILFWSIRIGQFNQPFSMPKFRSMKVDAPVVATHIFENPDNYLTKVGRFLRSTSLDELPQFWSILIGEMSFVGPRPALFSQVDLIEARTALGVDKLLPGLTGWAQVNGRDEISLGVKLRLDLEYLQKKSIFLDLKIIWLTLIKVMSSEGISH